MTKGGDINHIITSVKSYSWIIIFRPESVLRQNDDVTNLFNFLRGISSVSFKFLFHTISESWKYGGDWFFPTETWFLNCGWYWEYTGYPCIHILHLKFGGIKMQEHFVNIANVSLENVPYFLALQVTYTLALLKGGSKLLHSYLVVSTSLMYIKQ